MALRAPLYESGTANVGFETEFWSKLNDDMPLGILRYPGGNWACQYHFHPHVNGVNHPTNGLGGTAVGPFSPDKFLDMINEMRSGGGDIVPLIHTGAVHTSSEEAAAWVAFMVGSTTDTTNIGQDSLNLSNISDIHQSRSVEPDSV